MIQKLTALAFAIFFLTLALAAGATTPPPRALGGAIVLRAPGQAHGPLELVPKEGGYAAEFLIANEGADPLNVSRVAIRGDDDDVRAPAKVSVRLAEGGAATTIIAPGTTKKVLVQWLPDKEPRMKQMFAHVVVTSSDERSGEVAMGVTARIAHPLPWITDHPLTWLVFLPLLGVVTTLGMHLAGRKGDRSVRNVAFAIATMQCLLAFWVYSNFNADVTRVDGNDGFQFVEHQVWIRQIHAEYFVGVDGTSVTMVLLTSILSLVAVLSSFGTSQSKGFYAMLMFASAGLMGVFVSLDLLLLFSFWQLALVPMYFLVGLWGSGKRGHAAMKFALVTMAGSALFLLAVVALYNNADRTFLVDGTQVTRTFSIPELSRVAFNAKRLSLFGLPFVKVVWVALFLAFAVTIPVFPMHTWLPDAHASAPTPASVLLSGVLSKMGAYGILRVSFSVLPEATRWAAGALVAFGVVNLVYGSLCALGQKDLKRLFAYGSVAQMGFCLIGLGALTPQGIAGCIVQMYSHGLVVAMLFLLIGALEDRVGTRDLTKLGGLGGEMPLYSAFLGLAIVASLGLPGTSGFWGEALALLGAFPSYRVLSIAAAGGLVLSAAYHLWTLQRVVLGPLDETWRKHPQLEPFGGRFPELTSREMTAIGPLAVMCIVIGFWPVPLLSVISGGVRDATILVNPPGPDQIAIRENEREGNISAQLSVR